MATSFKDIQLTTTDRVARITLARPPLNILTISMMKEIVEAVQQIASKRDVCAIVFAGSAATRAFSAGVSVEEHRAESAYQMLEAFNGIFRALNNASKPVLALVSGAALGGGCELVAFADIVIAAKSAKFGQPEIKMGVFPAASAVILPRVIGEKKAREIILTGELVDADEAKAIGLINYVVQEGELEAKAEEVLAALRQMSVPALEIGRRAMADAAGLPFEQALKKAEDLYLNQLMSCRDASEGIQALIEKRPAVWKHK